ncbi:MAG: PAS domain S-box protein [Archaeoglobaceae archaeon]
MKVNWKEILDKTLAGVYISDRDGRIIYVNDIIEKATLYSKEELYKMTIYQLAFPEDRKKAEEFSEKVFSGETVFYEIRYVRKDGEIRWIWGFAYPIEIDGKIFALGNWIDITRLKKLENELRNREEFYRVLIEESLTPVYIVQNRRILYVNKAFEELTGYSKEELLGKDFFMLHPEDREFVIQRYLERERGLRDIETYSFRILSKDGRVKWVTVRPARIIYNGAPAVAATALDTTEIHELNEELKFRAEYLSILNSILRHDIANALTTIALAFEIDDPGLKKRAQEKIEYITKLIRDVRNLESATEIKKPINIAGIVREIAKCYPIETKLKDVMVYANEGLKSVLENVISNSFIHGGENVKVTVEVYKDRDWAVCRISDDGKGIPDEIKSKIFEKGFSTANRTGMGLFIAKWIIETFGGRIEVKDNKPREALFEIYLRTLAD